MKYLGYLITVLAAISWPLIANGGGERIYGMQYIDATGQGDNQAEAIADAIRMASERLIGVYVYNDTSTGVEGRVARGVVRKFDTLGMNRLSDGKIFVRLRAYYSGVDLKKVASSFALDPMSKNIEEISYIRAKQEQLKEAKRLLNKLTGNVDKYFNSAYSVDYNGYVVEGVGADYVKGYIAVYIGLNPVYWDNYFALLNSITESENDSIMEGAFTWLDAKNLPSVYDDPGGPGRCGGKIWTGVGEAAYYVGQRKAVSVNRSLRGYLAKPIVLTAYGMRGVSEYSLIIFKNLITSSVADHQIDEFEPMMDSSCKSTKWFASTRPPLSFSEMKANNFYGELFVSQTKQNSGDWVVWIGRRAVNFDASTGLVKIPFKVKSEKDLEELPKRFRPDVKFATAL